MFCDVCGVARVDVPGLSLSEVRGRRVLPVLLCSVLGPNQRKSNLNSGELILEQNVGDNKGEITEMELPISILSSVAGHAWHTRQGTRV